MNDIFQSHISLKSLTSSVTLPVHDPISFGFEEMVKAKADSAKVKQELVDIGKGLKDMSENSSNDNMIDKARSEYIYDYNVVAELSEIRRRKNRR